MSEDEWVIHWYDVDYNWMDKDKELHLERLNEFAPGEWWPENGREIFFDGDESTSAMVSSTPDGDGGNNLGVYCEFNKPARFAGIRLPWQKRVTPIGGEWERVILTLRTVDALDETTVWTGADLNSKLNEQVPEWLIEYDDPNNKYRFGRSLYWTWGDRSGIRNTFVVKAGYDHYFPVYLPQIGIWERKDKPTPETNRKIVIYGPVMNSRLCFTDS